MTGRILIGDAIERLAELPDESVHCICTSPPYWRQRDYGDSGQIGIEATPEEYIETLTAVFREASRVLRSDGSCWINIGDKWAASGNGGGGCFMAERGERAWKHAKTARGWRSAPPGYKPKDLIGLPFMLAFAMRADGWYWRSTEIWAKSNGMPESARDRPAVAHEYVLHFAKSPTYYWDDEAISVPLAPSSALRLRQKIRDQLGSHRGNGGRKANGPMHAVSGIGADGERTARIRSVWWLPVANSSDAHFAVMPDELAAVVIMAACPVGGTVLDPFLGSGTTAAVAQHLGRDWIGIELNPEFVEIAERRTRQWGLTLEQAPEAAAE